MQMKGVVSAVIGLTSRMLEHYGASVSEVAAVRLGGLAPARPIIQRTMQMKGVVSAVIGLTSRMLEHYGASVSEVADNTEARSQ